MKAYPTIPREVIRSMSIYAFAKLDGSNIRAEWSRKKGFYKFGSRKRLLGTDQNTIPEAEELVRAQEKEFAETFRKNQWSMWDCDLFADR